MIDKAEDQSTQGAHGLSVNMAAQSTSDSNSRSRFSVHVAWTFLARILMIGNSVFAGIIVAHWLGVSGVGQLAVINVSIQTLVQLASLGLPSANTYFIAQEQKNFRAAAINSLIFSVIIGSLLALSLSAAAQFQPSWFGQVNPNLIRLAALSIPFQLLTLIGLNIFLAIGKVREFNLLDILSQSFVLINAIIVLVVLNHGLLMLVALNTTTSVLVCLLISGLIAYAARSTTQSNWRADASLMERAIRYGIKSHIAIIAGALIFRADLLVVNHYRGDTEAGVYSVASQMALMLMLLPSVIATLLFPRITAEQDSSAEKTCSVSRHASFVMFFCCLAALPLALFIPTLYGSGFADAPFQLWIMLPGVYLVGVESVLVQHFNAIGLPKSIPLFWVITLAFNIVSVFLLVPRFGARGAAVASTISYILIFILVAIYFLRSAGRTPGDVFLLRGSELRGLLSFRRFDLSNKGTRG